MCLDAWARCSDRTYLLDALLGQAVLLLGVMLAAGRMVEAPWASWVIIAIEVVFAILFSFVLLICECAVVAAPIAVLLTLLLYAAWGLFYGMVFSLEVAGVA